MSARGLDENLAPEGRRLPALARMPAFPRSRTALMDGNRAVYPGQGPCRIDRVAKKVVDGRVMMFYHLTVLDAKGGELFVPVEKASSIGVRLLMKKSEIPRLLAHLRKGAKPADNWKQRANDNLKLFSSGSPFALAEVVASLTEQKDSRPLTLGESGTLDKARRLLISEISEVMGVTRTVAEGRVDQALQKGGLHKPRPVGLDSLASD